MPEKRTGRPPLFGRAMSNAEHQARWREREAAKLPPPGFPTADDVFASIPTTAGCAGRRSPLRERLETTRQISAMSQITP
jgi:hypothetical protein